MSRCNPDHSRTAAENNATPSDFQLRILLHHLFGAFPFHKLHDPVIALYFATRLNYARIDSDLKYRYKKMKGEATTERISELEELFELNRDNAKIRQIKKDVEEYEHTTRQKIELEDETRLKERGVEHLTNKANSIKKK